MTSPVEVRLELQKLQEDVQAGLRKILYVKSGEEILQDLQEFQSEHAARTDWTYGDSRTLQQLQNDEPSRCPACHQPISKVYCTPLSDTEVRLQLKRNGQSVYAGPCHRVNIL